MAQSGYTPISLYFSTTSAAVPTAGNLVAGELALNTNDGKLYYKNSSGVVTLLAGSTSGPAGGSTTQVQYNNAGVLAGITGATTNGTALTLVAPVLGTPASGLATNLTGLPLTTGVTGTLPVANGGTGLTAGTSGGLLAYTATGTLASSALLTLYGVVYGGGVGAVPVATAAGTTGQVLQATTGGAPVWGSTYAGSVSSVGFTGGLISVATATTTPALTVAGTSGGVVYFSSASTWASSALLSANSLMIGGGSGAAPATTTTGTGVVTALGVNTGTAGAFVVNGGALGSPSSAGTIPAFTLGGTVAGGGNQLNNVIIGTTTPLAGAFTTLSATGLITSTVASGQALFLNASGGNTSIELKTATGTATDWLLQADGSGGLNRFHIYSISASAYLATFASTGAVSIPGTLAAGATTVTGTLTATAQLSIAGNAGFAGVTTANANNAISLPQSTYISWFDSGSSGATTHYMTSNGSVLTITGNTAVTGTLSATQTISATGGLALSVNDPAMTINYQRVLRFNDSSNTSWAGYLASNGSGLGVGGNTFLSLEVGGNTYAYINSSGNLGIGTTSPVANNKLTIDNGANNYGLRINSSASPGLQLSVNGTSNTYITGDATAFAVEHTNSILLRTNNADRVTIDSSGNLLLGPTSSTGLSGGDFAMKNAGSIRFRNAANNAYVSALLFTSSNGLDIGAGGSLATITFGIAGIGEVGRFNTSGLFLVGETAHTDGSMFYNSANSVLNAWRGSTTAGDGLYGVYSNIGGTKTVRGYFRCDGGLANYSANNLNLSDERLKKDITISGNYLAKICAIEVKNFRYKTQDESEDITLGVIAQDVEAVAPELISNDGFGETPEDGIPLKAIYQTDLQYALMKCIQEQQAIITALTTRITALENK